MSQTFFRLTHHDWVECFTKLNRSEIGVLFYLRTLNPFGDRHLKINCQAIGEILDIHRTSVSRALKKLEGQKLIELEIVSAQVKLVPSDNDTKQKSENPSKSDTNGVSVDTVHPRTECASTHSSVHPRTERCAPTHSSVHPRTESVHPRTINIPEPPPDKASETPQTLKTYSDFRKTLSESERENFFSFVRKKIENLEKPINDLEAWLASKNSAKRNRWEVYYEIYQQEKISQRKKPTTQGNNLENYDPQKLQDVIKRFQNRGRINQPESENTSREVDREEIKRQQAEINRLMDNPPEYEERKSPAQLRREAITEMQRQREANRKAAEERAKQQNQSSSKGEEEAGEYQDFDLESYEDRILRQVEEFNRLHGIGNINENDEIDEEGLENE